MTGGAATRIRTEDQCVTNAPLLPLSYRGEWSHRQASNLRSIAYEAIALPTKLRRLMVGVTGFEPATS